MFDFVFFINAALLGAALAVDAFSVSVVNGISEPNIKRSKAAGIAAVFAVFQCIMPLLGWIVLELLVTAFSALKSVVPYAALAILTALGVKSVVESLKKHEDDAPCAVTFGALMFQGLATSLDALSVGLTLEGSGALPAAVTSLIIGAVTFAICIIGVYIGKSVGKAVSRYAGIIGGVALIAIGIEIFIRGII